MDVWIKYGLDGKLYSAVIKADYPKDIFSEFRKAVIERATEEWTINHATVTFDGEGRAYREPVGLPEYEHDRVLKNSMLVWYLPKCGRNSW